MLEHIGSCFTWYFIDQIVNKRHGIKSICTKTIVEKININQEKDPHGFQDLSSELQMNFIGRESEWSGPKTSTLLLEDVFGNSFLIFLI